MGHCYPHLSLEERRKIAKWREAKMSIPEIAERLCRAASTIYRELKRNVFVDSELPQLNGYFAVTAQEAYERRRANHCKLARHQSLKLSVLDRLRAGWSPEQIAGRMRLEAHPLRVSHETIYRFAYSKAGRAEAFFQLLPEQRRRRRPRGHRRQNRMQAVDFPSLRLRPEHVSQRLSFGHWECDLVMFQKEHGKVNVTSLVERVSRYAVIFRNEDRRSTPIMETLINGLAPLPADARQSITFDRGTEFSAWRRLKDGIGADSWFCDPQSPWQKGTVENTNNRLRRYLPRSTDPTALTNRYLKSICQRLNTTPRKCLHWRTPSEVFQQYLAEIERRIH